jgi:hypothetical protein
MSVRLWRDLCNHRGSAARRELDAGLVTEQVYRAIEQERRRAEASISRVVPGRRANYGLHRSVRISAVARALRAVSKVLWGSSVLVRLRGCCCHSRNPAALRLRSA